MVCTSAPACDAGASVLASGGNAVDAAVATAFALAVTHPAAGNIGGGGFMIVRTPTGELASFDFREQAPLKATPTMYVGKDGKIDRSLTSAGYLAPGVPAPSVECDGAQEVRQTAMEGRRHAGRPARRAGLHDVGGARARPQPRSGGADGESSRRRSLRTANQAAANGAEGID